MSIVPYAPYSRSLKRAYDGSMSPYLPKRRLTLSQIQPYANTRAVGYSRRRYGGYRGGRRNKFSNLNTWTNPVYPRPEVKSYDISLGTLAAPVSITSAGTVTTLNAIPQGVGTNQRIGQQVATKSVYYQIVFNVGATPAPNAMRHMLLWDRQHNLGGGPSIADIFSATGTVPILTSPLNLQNRERFVVLSDDRFTLSPNGDQIRYCAEFRKINQITTYHNDAALDLDPTTGALILVMISDEATAANQPTFYGTWRTRFIDN